MTALTKFKKIRWELWLPLLAVIALPFGRSVEVFTILMAILGINDLIKNNNALRQSSRFKIFSTFFLCFWLPAICSLPDAVNIHHSATNTVGMLRFYFAGLFIINRISSEKDHLWLGMGIAIILLFWSLDAWLQLLSGTNILGSPPLSENRISGVFGRHAKLGLMIIPFLGISISVLIAKFSSKFAIASILLITSTILISGDRAAWISLITALFLWLFLFRPEKFSVSRYSFIIGVAGLTLMSLIVINTPQFHNRLNGSLNGLEFNYKAINTASSNRLPIWKIALEMFKDNPINGVGTRGFRYAYPDYAEANDMFLHYDTAKDEKTGASHAHQIILEFMSDTGFIGVSGYIIALWLLFIKWRPLARSRQSTIASGYLISLMVILFPINTHLSFFSSSWAQVIWLLVALCVSSFSIKQKQN